MQLEAYLDRIRIDRAHIKGIGSAKRAALLSYGVETAADVQEYKVLSVPGFGQQLCKRLLYWRQSHEKKFKFDPARGVDPVAKAAVERQILSAKVDLEKRLKEEASKLMVIGKQISARRDLLHNEALVAAREFAQAEADYNALSGA